MLSKLGRYYDYDSIAKRAIVDVVTGERARNATNFRLSAKFNVKALQKGPTYDRSIDEDDTLLIEGKWYKPSITQSLSPSSTIRLTPLQQLVELFKGVIMSSKLIKGLFQAMLPSFMIVETKMRLQVPKPLHTATYDSDGIYLLTYTKDAKHERRRELFRVLNE